MEARRGAWGRGGERGQTEGGTERGGGGREGGIEGVNHNALFVASGGSLVAQRHLWMHFTRQMDRIGNMRLGSTYPEESLNKALAKVCRETRPFTLALMCLKK